ncbi:hypothetical protein TSUD_411550 [Trifolium subterraneum]|uniref:Uncharacterized protein n=1 Tax=Trifolium subterraneum TaxID=3900 RepID=A0A2Z6P836_TRISU|nr:hypothetical protein TSUD_411550 [Trifolium subterraneum]
MVVWLRGSERGLISRTFLGRSLYGRSNINTLCLTLGPRARISVSGFPRKVYEDEDGNPLLDIETEGNHAEIVDLDNVGERIKDETHPSKVAQVDETDASTSGRVPSVVPRFVIPPVMGSQELLKQKSVIVVSDAEKTVMDDMGPDALKNEFIDAMVSAFKLMEIASYLNGKECKYLEERDAAKEEAVFFKQKLEHAKVNHAAYMEKYVLQAGLLIKLYEKEKEAARLTIEKGGLEGQLASLVAEKENSRGQGKRAQEPAQCKCFYCRSRGVLRAE